MFEVEEGGVSTPIDWGKDNLAADKSFIVIDEDGQVLWLWHGQKQNLVARRVALRQAESLKGHGFQVGKSIIGRGIKRIVEIDARKIGREPETSEQNKEFEKLLSRKFQLIGDNIISFTIIDEDASASAAEKPKPKPKPKPEPVKEEPTPAKVEPKPEVKAKIEPVVEPIPKLELTPKPAKKEPITVVSEYDAEEEEPTVAKTEPKPKLQPVKAEPVVKKTKDSLSAARMGFVLVSIMLEFSDVWASMKEDGSIAVEMMDGPVCEFKIEGSSIKFTTNSFTGIAPDKKIAIQEKFVELSKLLK